MIKNRYSAFHKDLTDRREYSAANVIETLVTELAHARAVFASIYEAADRECDGSHVDDILLQAAILLHSGAMEARIRKLLELEV